jgi:hypothetical protein
MTIVLDCAERESLYNLVLTDLTGIRDVTLHLDAGRVEEAQKLGRRFAQDVALLDQLGWEPAPEPEPERYELELSDAEALAICQRFCQLATGIINDAISQRGERALDDAFRVAEFCGTVIQRQTGA